MTAEEKRHWKRFHIHTKLIIDRTGEEYICETIDISQGGIQGEFSDNHNLKINDICKILTSIQEENVFGIDINSSSNDLISVSVSEDTHFRSHIRSDVQDITDWEEFPVLAVVTWVNGSSVGFEFEEALTDKAKMPNWFKNAFYSKSQIS